MVTTLSNPPLKIRRKSRRWIVIAVFLLTAAVGYFVVKKSTPKPGEDWHIDYVTILHEERSKDIKPEENVNALLWQAIGPHPAASAEYFKLLGIPEPPKEGNYFISWWDDCKARGIPQEEQSKQFEQFTGKPWKSSDLPDVANWLKKNQTSLAIIAKAVERKKYYNPLVPPSERSLHSVQLPTITITREMGTALIARARNKLAEGDRVGAWDDLMIALKLGRHFQHGSADEVNLGGTLQENTIRAMYLFIHYSTLSSDQALSYLKEIESLPQFVDPTDVIDKIERYCLLSELQHPHDDEWPSDRKRLNDYFDSLVEAIRTKDRTNIAIEISALENDLMAQKAADFTAKRKAADKPVLPYTVFSLAVSSYTQMINADASVRQQTNNFRLALALDAYRTDNKRYPDVLAQLTPKYIDKIPNDLFANQPLIYLPKNDSYLLYSVGPNGKDDGGQERPNGDDIVLEMPLPADK